MRGSLVVRLGCALVPITVIAIVAVVSALAVAHGWMTLSAGIIAVAVVVAMSALASVSALASIEFSVEPSDPIDFSIDYTEGEDPNEEPA